MITYSLLYLIAFILHATALVYGVKLWYLKEEEYTKSNILDLHINQNEREFLIVCSGCAANLLYIMVIPLYLIKLDAISAGVLELLFCAFHLLAGISTYLYHMNTYARCRQEGV